MNSSFRPRAIPKVVRATCTHDHSVQAFTNSLCKTSLKGDGKKRKNISTWVRSKSIKSRLIFLLGPRNNRKKYSVICHSLGDQAVVSVSQTNHPDR